MTIGNQNRPALSETIEEFFRSSSDKLVVLCYPPGAGGKFVSNCLSLSDMVFPLAPKKPNSPVYIRRILDRISRDLGPGAPQGSVRDVLNELGATADESGPRGMRVTIEDFPLTVLRFFKRYRDVDTRLDWVRGTLPRPASGLSGWKDLEFLPESTYGFAIGDPRFRSPVHFETEFFTELFESGFIHFTVCHRENNLPYISQIFPDCRQIVFVNTGRWIDYCVAHGKPFDHQFNIPETSLSLDGIEFDVETFLDEGCFLTAMKELYDYFDLPVFEQEAIAAFHWDYLKAHDLR